MNNRHNTIKQPCFNLAEYKAQLLSIQVKRALVVKAQRGEFPGKAPIGYTNNTQTKQVVPDPKSWVVIKEALEKYATGKFTLGWITKFLNEKLPLVQYRERKPLTKLQVMTILRNPFYFGKFTFRGEAYFGNHKPMITEEIFSENQKRLNGGRM